MLVWRLEEGWFFHGCWRVVEVRVGWWMRVWFFFVLEVNLKVVVLWRDVSWWFCVWEVFCGAEWGWSELKEGGWFGGVGS
ncbi:hypothetical protein M758_5G135100 [Ceratodon purpureus]|nr:hypothetical protein M758_5G135100 [Ceratodon purpureus]